MLYVYKFYRILTLNALLYLNFNYEFLKLWVYSVALFLFSCVAISNSVPCYVSEYLTKLKVVAHIWSRTGHSTPSQKGPNSKSLMKRLKDLMTDPTRQLNIKANRPHSNRLLAHSFRRRAIAHFVSASH